MKKVITIVLFLFVGLVILSCQKQSAPAPGPPVITFLDFTITNETEAVLHFKFTDPDGDVGLNNDQDSSSSSPYYYDFQMRFQFLNYQNKFIDSTWYDKNTGLNDDSTIYGYRIPYVSVTNPSKPLTGEVKVQLSGYRPAIPDPTSQYWANTQWLRNFRFHFFIYDRAHHKSNVVYTPAFYYP